MAKRTEALERCVPAFCALLCSPTRSRTSGGEAVARVVERGRSARDVERAAAGFALFGVPSSWRLLLPRSLGRVIQTATRTLCQAHWDRNATSLDSQSRILAPADAAAAAESGGRISPCAARELNAR